MSPPAYPDSKPAEAPEGALLARAEERFLAAVDEEISAALASSASARDAVFEGLASSGLESATSLEDAVARLCGAGKRIRPRMLWLGYLARRCADDGEGGPSARIEGLREALAAASTDPSLDRVGAALELLHAFGLAQDDVMDDSDLRRGQPAVHRQMAIAHDRHDGADLLWARGSRPGVRFGESMAVLAGDLAFALAGSLVRGLPESAAREWDATVLELLHGQRLDLVFAAEGRVDGLSTSRVAQAKSAAYTVFRPLALGALLADPAAPVPAWLLRYGREVGQAFAVADDILGVWGDPAVTGKPVGDDVRHRKPTTVVGIVDDATGGEVARLLRERRPGDSDTSLDDTGLNDAGLNDAGVARILALMDEHRVRETARARLEEHVRAAHDAVRGLPCPTVRAELERQAQLLAARHT